MPRKPRKKSSTNTYHVVVKGNNRQLLFEAIRDYKKYIEILSLYKDQCHFNLFAYCLMSNHVHLLLQVTDVSLETIFRKINTHYAIWFNAKYQRTGHIQDGRYYSEPIEDDHYLFCAIRYIHSNPSKAGLEPMPGHSYPWTSIHEYKSHTNHLVDTDSIYKIYDPNVLLNNVSSFSSVELIDIDSLRKRLPDDVAQEIMEKECHCTCVTDFSSLPILLRNQYLIKLHDCGISFRQLNRITGISLGVIQRVVLKGHSS